MITKNIFSKFTSLVLVALLTGCACSSGGTNSLLVINLLDPDLYNDCHIQNSINVPLENLETYAKNLSHDREIVVYCSNYACTASKFAAKMLTKLGFKHVYAYEAGMAGWLQSKLPVTGPAQEKYLTNRNEAPSEHDTSIKIIATAELAVKMGLK